MMKITRKLLLAAGLALASVGGRLRTTRRSSSAARVSMTGIQAPLDTPGYNGAQVAVKYLNDNGGLLGKQVEFINIDGKSDPVTVGNVAVELIDKGAQLIVGALRISISARPASREAQSADTRRHLDLRFRPALFVLVARRQAVHALHVEHHDGRSRRPTSRSRNSGWKTAYVVTDQFIAYTKSLSKYFVEQFKANGGEILLEDTYTNGDNNFSAQLSRLQALGKKPDVIFVSSCGTGYRRDYPRTSRSGYDAPILGRRAPIRRPCCRTALGEKLGNNIFFSRRTP